MARVVRSIEQGREEKKSIDNESQSKELKAKISQYEISDHLSLKGYLPKRMAFNQQRQGIDLSLGFVLRVN